MTPDQVSGFIALAAIISKIGALPLGSILLAVVFGPWLAMGLITRGMEKRHAAAIAMYEENVKLVLNYEKTAAGLQDIIILSTQTMTQVKDRIDNNLFCPLMRKDRRVEKES